MMFVFSIFLLFTLVTAQPNTHDLDLASVVKNLQDDLHRLKIQVENLEESHKTCVSTLKSFGLVHRKRLLLPENDQSDHVAFSAHISSGFTAASLGKGHEVVYDVSDTNVGNGYDNVTGTFRAPSAGVYGFTWTICADNHGEIQVELVINGRQRGVNHVDSEISNDLDCSTAFVIEKVNMGDFVFIRSTVAGEGLFMSDGRARWAFSGWKLF
ncbi:complement C1q tumor necrosis factor-related protein 3-like [Mytilus trossulus]|uniref:complement C1q tumor necrosis factor-related protein 3-like n=1 Tax=Mytilus trossulus TaxID=6551 RepID=UPI00300680B5